MKSEQILWKQNHLRCWLPERSRCDAEHQDGVCCRGFEHWLLHCFVRRTRGRGRWIGWREDFFRGGIYSMAKTA